MFTGIIVDVGTVQSIAHAGDTRYEIQCSLDLSRIAIGASVAHDGVCLTVIEKKEKSYSVQVSAETLACTTLGSWQENQRINLEPALKIGDESGGHIVSGHVDGVAILEESIPDGESWRLWFKAPSDLSRFIAAKGSVTLDGVSLTVNRVNGTGFGVNIIPHTQAVTTFGNKKVGDRFNLEIDMLARYVARLLETQSHVK